MTTTVARSTVRWHRPLVALAGAMALLAIVAAAGLLIDDRVLVGAAIWAKPFKFAVSFAVYALTLAWMLSVLPRRSRLGERAATVIVAVSFIEMAIITAQTVRGHRSHFNNTNPFDSVLWSIMGASIMVLFVAHLVIAAVALQRRIPDRWAAYAVRWGLLLSALGLIVAWPMVMPSQMNMAEAISGAHAVGVPDGGPGLPLLGWSTTGGDLRIGHFVGMHGLQAMPLLALLLSRRTELDATTGARLISVGGIAYAGITILTTWQALRGQPLLRPDLLTLAALAVLVIGTTLGVRGVLRAQRLG